MFLKHKRFFAVLSLLSMVLQPMAAAAHPAQYSYFKIIPGLVVTDSAVAPPDPVATAQLSLSTTALSYGSVRVGVSAAQTVVVTNTGSATMSVSDIRVEDATNFNSSSTCGPSLAQAASCVITVSFTPSTTGPLESRLHLMTSATGNSSFVSLMGDGLQGLALFSLNSLTFLAQDVFTTSTAQNVTVTNNGTAPLVISGVSVDFGVSDFNQSNNCLAPIAIGMSCAIAVAMTPSVAGSLAGRVLVANDGSGGAGIITLGGTGMPGRLAMPASLEVGTSTIGTAVQQTLTVSNGGAGSLAMTVPNEAAITTNPTEFSFVSTTCTAVVAASSTCAVVVQFTPTATGIRAGVITVNGIAVVLTGTGTQGVISLAPSSAALTFEARQAGTTSPVKQFTVQNLGTGKLTFNNVSITTGAANYSSTTNCTSLNPAQSCTISVAFSPTTAGPLQGVLTFQHDGQGATTATLSGTGQAPSVSLPSPAVTATQTNTSSQFTAILTNTGIDTIAVTPPSAGSVTGARFSFISTTCGASLAAGATCNTLMQFTPSDTVAQTGTLAIATGAGVVTANLSATGVDASVQLAITANTSNYSLKTAAGNPTVAKDYVVTIAPGVIVTGAPAFTTVGMPVGSKLTIINNGAIIGTGGEGGSVYTIVYYVNQLGYGGGNAIETTLITFINNTGYIFGGGGGGGSYKGGDSSSGFNGGKGGGGGAGAGAGGWGYSGNGVPGTTGITGVGGLGSGSAGKGGEYGQPGSGSSGGTGGPAGKAVVHNLSVTWLAGNTGTQVKGAQ
ncbi:MAG: choice-of-anchor D domain-containing protein [Agitococcus sp.]|nr:choice-of-anchor D domain-containing protein [Agitococcus sp.]